MSLHRLTVIFSLLLPRNIASFNRSCISQFGRSQLYSTQRIDSNSGDCVEDNDCTKGYNESNEVINEDNNNNESNNSSNLFFDDPAKKIVGSFKPLMRIIFTCGICKSKVDKKFSKRSYEKGVVFITCPVCKVESFLNILELFEPSFLFTNLHFLE
jgi:hypothetical protein